MHILITKDRQMGRVILATHLRSWGHHVTEAADADEALRCAAENPGGVNMLITDWDLPGMGGLELARRLRGLSKADRHIYVLLLSERDTFAPLAEELSRGDFDDYLIKPFETAELQLRVQLGERILRAERAHRLQDEILERVVRRRTIAVRETQNEVLSRLFSALESRDEETAAHVRRIGQISACLGELLGWEAQRVDTIKTAAALHDIGKISVPDMVLRKSDPLTPAEFKLVTQHAAIGGRILSGSDNPVIRMAGVIARSHHENWDGSGYPDGLSREEIPVEARVTAVADVYDALLCERTYRSALAEDEALHILRNESGRKFDPAICALFIENFEEIRCRCVEGELAALPSSDDASPTENSDS